jgi:hypothetical protein
MTPISISKTTRSIFVKMSLIKKPVNIELHLNKIIDVRTPEPMDRIHNKLSDTNKFCKKFLTQITTFIKD